jgi:hypothetical protein
MVPVSQMPIESLVDIDGLGVLSGVKPGEHKQYDTSLSLHVRFLDVKLFFTLL